MSRRCPIIRRSLRTLWGKRRGTLLFMLFIAFVSFTLAIGFYYISLSGAFSRVSRSEMGAHIDFGNVQSASPSPLPEQIIKEAQQAPHVIGGNVSFVLPAVPVGFVNIVTHSAGWRASGGDSPSQIELETDTNIRMTGLFRTGNVHVLQGQIPSNSAPGAMIEDTLAKKKHLAIGDAIRFTPAFGNDRGAKSIKIIGIYHLQSPVQIGSQAASGITVYKEDPYSRVFVDYPTMAAWFPDETKITSMTFYIDDLANINAAYTALDRLDFDHSAYRMTDTTDYSFALIHQSFTALNRFINVTFLILAIAELIVLALITVIMLRSYFYEAGVLLALGETRKKISLQHIFQMFAPAVVGEAVGSVAAVICAPLVRSMILLQTTKPYANAGHTITFFDSERVALQYGIGSVSIGKAILISIGVMLVILAVFFLVSSIRIVRIQARRIFSKLD